MINFLLGFIVGTFVTGYVYEQTRRPNVIQNEIGKIKDSDGSTFDQTMGLDLPKPEPKPRKKFLGIFKRKPKP